MSFFRFMIVFCYMYNKNNIRKALKERIKNFAFNNVFKVSFLLFFSLFQV